MTPTRLFPNHLAKERAALDLSIEAFAERCAIDPLLYRQMEEGRILPSHEELDRIAAALGDVDTARLYGGSLLNTIGDMRHKPVKPNFQTFFDSYRDSGLLLVTPEEMKVIEQNRRPDRTADVFVNLSCGPQRVPDLMLDTLAVLRTLGLDVASGAGRQFCCGTAYRRDGTWDAAKRMHEASLARELAWGVSTVAHMCTQCVNTYNDVSHRHAAETGEAPSVTHTQVLRLIDERLEELGERVPWKKEVRARVLAHGHSTLSYVHDRAKRDVGAIARRIPGVEFVGFLDRISLDSFCIPEPGVPQRPRPRTREEVEAYRAELADIARDWGADTISPQHQGCYMYWMPFASDTVAVRHDVGILAEALGVANPNRFQTASRIGDPNAIVEHTRPVWSAWGMSQAKALEIATQTFGEPYAVDQCACGKTGGERCADDDLISLDSLRRGVASAR
jgi:Fe-S oxidoreductase